VAAVRLAAGDGIAERGIARGEQIAGEHDGKGVPDFNALEVGGQGKIRNKTNRQDLQDGDGRTGHEWEGFSTAWKMWQRFFHGMENFSGIFPRHGKVFRRFSTLWKKVFHTVENPD
jgi:hypothetical protein